MATEDGIDDFEAGYLGKDAPAEKPTQEPEKTAEVTVEPTEAAAPAVPEAETKPEPEPEPEWKKEIAALRAENEKLAQRTRNVEGHIGGLTNAQRLLQESMAAAKAAAPKADAPTEKQLASAIEDPAEWKVIEEDYPEFAKATKALMAANKQPQFDTEAFQRKVSEQVQGQTAAVRQEIIESALDVVLPGWTEKVKTDDFQNWAKAQNDEVKALISSTKVGDAARMLRLFSEHLAKPPAPPAPTPKPQNTGRQERFAAAVAPKGTAGVTASRSDEDEFEAGYAGR